MLHPLVRTLHYCIHLDTNLHPRCTCWCRDVFTHPLVRTLDYFIRLDTDSKLLGAVAYDLFAYARSAGLGYGYRAILQDGGWVGRVYHAHQKLCLNKPPPTGAGWAGRHVSMWWHCLPAGRHVTLGMWRYMSDWLEAHHLPRPPAIAWPASVGEEGQEHPREVPMVSL